MVISYQVPIVRRASFQRAFLFSAWLSTWAIVAKVVRAQTLVTLEKAYIEAAKAIGASKTRILIYHVLPDMIGVVVANFIYVAGLVIMIQTSLDFFGFKRFLFSTDPNLIPVKVAPVLTWGVCFHIAPHRLLISKLGLRYPPSHT